MWLFSVVVLLSFCSAPAEAQLSGGRAVGSVVASDGSPIPGAHIIVADTTLGAASDATGRFEVALPAGDHTLVASAVGFRTERRSVSVAKDETVTIDFTLAEITVSSSEIVVTAGRHAQLSSNVPASLYLISPRQLSTRSLTALDEALRFVPGVQVLGNQVNVRGSSGFTYNTGSRVLLLLDGLPLLTPDSDGLPFDALPFAQIERIEIVKGPGSALFGGGALGGTIQVITRDYPTSPETNVQAHVGVHEPVRYQIWRDNWPDGGDEYRPFWAIAAGHARRLGDKAGFWVNADVRRDPGFANLSEESFAQVFAKIGWNPSPSSRFSLLLAGLRRERDTFLFWNGLDDALNPGRFALGNPAEPTGSNDNVTNQFSVQPAFVRVLSNKLFLESRARLFGTVIRPIDEEGNPKSIEDGTLGFRYGGEFQLNWRPRPGRYVIVGVAADANTTDSSFFTSSDGDEIGNQPEGALFMQWEETIRERLRLVAGARFDGYRIDATDTVTKLSPKLGLTYAVAPSLTVRAAFGQGFRVPSLAERFVDDQSFLPLFRNLDLRPEESTSIELGSRLLTALGDQGGLRLDVSLFWNGYRDLIEPKLVRFSEPGEPARLGFQFINVTRARIRGLEISVDGSLYREALHFFGGYTLLDPDDLDIDEPLPFRPRHLFKGGVDARLIGGLEGGFDVRLASVPERIESDFIRFVPDSDVLVPTRIVDGWIAYDLGRYRISVHSRNMFEYYYLERPALLGAPRSLLVRLESTW